MESTQLFIYRSIRDSRSYIVLIRIIQPDLRSELALRLSSFGFAIILPYFLYLPSPGEPGDIGIPRFSNISINHEHERV